METEYDEATARHYAAYRPPLHGRILQPVLGRLPRFERALDLGCGAGHSTIALTAFAENVVGTDTARAMIRAADERWGDRAAFVHDATHPVSWYFHRKRFDLFTLAGVLPYLDPEATLDGIFSSADREARVVVYDFEVKLNGIYRRLGYRPAPAGYRHDVELPESERPGFRRLLKVRSQLNFSATTEEVAHLLLAVKDFRLWAKKEFGDDGTPKRLTAAVGGDVHQLTAVTWCSLFALQG